MSALKRPQSWLYIWGGLGAIFLLYVIIAASVQQGTGKSASALNRDSALLTGEMADFQYALPPRKAPPDVFALNGEPVSLANFRGQMVVLNFWATWCAPCLKELPSLDALQERLGGRGVAVVAVAADPAGPEAARAMFDRLNIANLELYTDETLSFASAVGAVDVLPVTVLYDAYGREIGRLIGDADWASDEAVRLVRSAAPS
ncbi:MAG: TlpA disulfide reductase family protein [Pseudomonadota bacterium]